MAARVLAMVLGAAFCVLAAVLVVRRGDKGADEPRRTPGARTEAPFSGGMIDVGGRRLYLDCVGSGSPTVVLEAVGRDWWRRGLATWPKSLAPKLRRAFATRVQDGVDVRASGALDRRVRTLADTRLIVITAARQHDLFRGPFANPPARLYRNTSRGWRRLQNELAKLSRDSAHVVALRSDHFVADDDPDVVVEAVEAVTRATRQTAPLPPCGRIFAGSDVRCLS